MTRQACAIYTRKSSEEGLDQGFNSLDAQREACEAYILSQKHAGWIARPDMYDDGGLSGGTMERPALQRLLADIKAGKVQTVVVYKVDRLTRSLTDFARIVDVLDAHDVSFVSVTQQFNTTTSMGRLTLNMLLSFAQFEREIAGERIRDKFAASKAKGMWMGGFVPLGYDVENRRLVVNPAEAETVRLIFQRYTELGSVILLRAELQRRGIVSKKREAVSLRWQGGTTLTRGALYHMLQNRLYRGEVAYRGNVYPGQHDAIVEPDLWQSVQDKLASHRRERRAAVTAPSLLAGMIFDRADRCLTPTHANKQGKRYRYYISAALKDGAAATDGGLRIPAGEIEGLVLDRLRSFLNLTSALSDALAPLNLDARVLDRALQRGRELAKQWTTLQPQDKHDQVQAIVDRVMVSTDRIELLIGARRLAQALDASPLASADHVPPVTLAIEAMLRRVGKGKAIVVEGGTPLQVNDGLVSLLREAFAARDILLADTDETLNAITARLGKSKGHLTWLMRLTTLSPQIIADILAGEQPVELTPRRLLRLSRDLPLDWAAQRAVLGFKG